MLSLGLKAVGVQAIVAKGFARIFYRAAINQGLLLVECPAAVEAYKPGDTISLDVTAGTIEYYDFSEMTNLSVDYQSAHALREALRDWLARGWEGSVFFTPRDYQFGMIRMIGAVMESIHGAPSEYMIPSREPIALAEIRNFIDEHRQSSGPG